MPLLTVEEIIKEKLAFVPDTAWQTKILTYKNEQMYYLNTYLKISETNDPVEIEDESKWTGMARLLLAEVTAYNLIIHKAIETTGGTETSSTGAGSKIVKKGKADVVEAEFEVAKAEDGRTIALKTSALLPVLKENICRYAQTLGIFLPGYCGEESVDIPAFLIKEF